MTPIEQLRTNRAAFLAALLFGLIGAAAGLAALAAAPLGLGSQENFWFYRQFHLSRYDLAIDAVSGSLCFLGLAAFLSPAFPRCAGRVAMAGGWMSRLARRSDRTLSRPAVLGLTLVGIAAAINAVLILGFGSDPVLYPDSPGYLAFSPTRSIGYPLLLSGLHALRGSLDWLMPIQLNLMLFSFVVLGVAVRRVSGHGLAGFTVAVLLMVDRSLHQFAFFVITESLFIALITLHAAFALNLISRFSRSNLLLCFASLAAATIVRPAGYSLFLGIPLLALLLRSHWKQVVGVGVGVSAAFMAGASLAAFAVSGVLAPQSFGGVTLVGHLAPMIQADTPFDDRELIARIDQGLRPYRRQFAGLAYPRQYWQVTADSNDPLLYGVIWPEISRRVQETQGDLAAGPQLKAVNDVAMRLSLAVIGHDPLGYLAHVIAHFYGIWAGLLDLPESLPTVLPRERAIMAETLRRSPELAGYGLRGDIRPPGRLAAGLGAGFESLGAAVGTLHLLITGAALLATVIGLRRLLTGRGRPSAATASLVYLALQLQAYFLFIAAVQAALSRYSAAFEPFVVALVVIFAATMRLSPLSSRPPGLGS